MKLILDCRGTGEGATGVGLSTRFLKRSLLETSPDHSQLVALCMSSNTDDEASCHGMLYAPYSPTSHPATELWEALVLRRRLKKMEASLFHAPAFRTPLLGHLPCVTTIHDLAAFHAQQTIPLKFRLYLHLAIHHTMKTAKKVVCPSKTIQNELMSLFPKHRDKIEAIPWGTPRMPMLSASEARERRKALGLPTQYFVSTGAGEPRKNHVALIQALDRLPTKKFLVLTGGRLSFKQRAFLDRTNMAPYIIELGYLDSANMCAVLSGAVALLYPSLYEGFGFPLLEAMSMSVPVFTSRIGAMQEIAGDAAVFADPHSVVEMTEAISSLMENPSLCEELVYKGHIRSRQFDWMTTAQMHWNLYDRTIMTRQ